MTAARRSHEDEGELPSQIGAPESSAGGAGRADPVFHPNNGEVNRSNQFREIPDRFSQQLRRSEIDEPAQRKSRRG